MISIYSYQVKIRKAEWTVDGKELDSAQVYWFCYAVRRHVYLFLEHVGAIHNFIASFMETIEATMNFLDAICSQGTARYGVQNLLWISAGWLRLKRPDLRWTDHSYPLAWDDGNNVDVQSHHGSLDRLHHILIDEISILIGFFRWVGSIEHARRQKLLFSSAGTIWVIRDPVFSFMIHFALYITVI
jgi:hypothetical protein